MSLSLGGLGGFGLWTRGVTVGRTRAGWMAWAGEDLCRERWTNCDWHGATEAQGLSIDGASVAEIGCNDI